MKSKVETRMMTDQVDPREVNENKNKKKISDRTEFINSLFGDNNRKSEFNPNRG